VYFTPSSGFLSVKAGNARVGSGVLVPAHGVAPGRPNEVETRRTPNIQRDLNIMNTENNLKILHVELWRYGRTIHVWSVTIMLNLKRLVAQF
jgi:hypothetical protein